MKSLVFVFVLFFGIVGCPKGPSDNVAVDQIDSTQVDSTIQDSTDTLKVAE